MSEPLPNKEGLIYKGLHDCIGDFLMDSYGEITADVIFR